MTKFYCLGMDLPTGFLLVMFLGVQTFFWVVVLVKLFLEEEQESKSQ